MPTKTKQMVRKASIGDAAPLAKQIKKEASESARVILDSDKVETATKELAKIPKKKTTAKSDTSKEFSDDSQVSIRTGFFLSQIIYKKI